MENVKNYIYSKVANHELDKGEAKKMLLELMNEDVKQDTDIAIIGMSGRFPNAPNLKVYWDNIKSGINSVREIPQNRIKDCEAYIKRFHYDEIVEKGYLKEDGHIDVKYDIRGYLDEIDKFDAHFFNIPPREARAMDPCQRFILEESYGALEDGGYSFDSLNGTDTGVFVGIDHVSELMYKKIAASDPMVVTGTWPGILASRVSYVLNLKGPCMVIDTACSSGLVCVHEACKAINTGECNMAVVGGVSSIDYMSTKLDDGYKELGSIESLEDKVKAFDQNADGTVWGEGVGVVVLKKLSKAIEDGDPIHAVIKGSAINNDGASNGITAPDVEMQKRLLTAAWKNSKVNPTSIQYIEAHGTGTKLGDPIEIKAITDAFNKITQDKQFCGIGSVKSNIGHLVAASGMASLIKVILMMENKTIVPTINFSSPNSFINFVNSPVYVVDRCREWVKKEEPRRAGINSFGFSGTNCHAILEESPMIKNGEIVKEREKEIFTISAKTKGAFINLVEKYYDYLINLKDGENKFSSICYTSKIGRGHYSYRLALIVKDYNDLIEKLSNIRNSDLNDLKSESIYLGIHRIVSDNKKVKDVGEITESYRRKLNVLAQEEIEELSSKSEAKSIMELCNLYVRGATIKWNELYEDKKIKKINMPVYTFEKTRCWFEEENISHDNTINIKKEKYKTIPHPLIDRCCIESMYQDIYETSFNVDRKWVLGEHKIFNNHVLPGTAYIEMAIEACKKYYSGSVNLRDVIFYKPLIVEKDEERKVQTILTKKDGYIQVTVASKIEFEDIKEAWIQHCECKVYGINNENLINEKYNIDLIKSKLDNEKFEEKLINIEQKGSKISLGERWQNDKALSVGSREALIELELPEKLCEDVNMFTLHTALFDNSVNAVSQKIGEGLYLPFYFKNIIVYKPLGSKVYSYIKIKNENNKDLETVTFDVDILDPLGNVIAKVENYSTKKVNKSEVQFKNQFKKQDSYFKMKWVPKKSLGELKSLGNDTILILKNQDELSSNLIRNLTENRIEVIEVEVGQRYKKISDNKYQIDISEYDFGKLFKSIKDKNITKIVHMISISNKKVETLNELEQCEDLGINSAFYMTRALINNKYSKNIDILIISNYANEVTGDELVINPQSAPLLGMSMVITKEHSNLKCKAIDIDNNVTSNEIINELFLGENINKVAYRNKVRYVEELSKTYFENKNGNKLGIVKNGVYVITGGTGGLGLQVGKHIAEANRAKIVLISRSEMPAREEWNRILMEGSNKKTKRAIEAIKYMEETGSKVINIRANICNKKEMVSIFDDLRENYGEIKGIVHCAGLAGDGLIIRKDKEIFDKVVSPKIYGTWILNDITMEDKLDFFVMFSSILSMFGDIGQSDYVAGNSYMDSFAAYRNRQGKRTVAINWPSWKETGMAVDYGVDNKGSLVESIETDKALNYIDEAINSNLSQVMPGTLNYSRIIQIKDELRFYISEEIENNIKKLSTNHMKSKKEEDKEVTIKGKKQDCYSKTENKLTQIWCKVLGVDELDVYDSFYSLGGDSLMAIELLKELEKTYEGILDITDVFTYSTVVQMAEYIDGKLGEGKNNNETYESSKEIIISQEEIEYTLSNAQERIWFLQKMEPNLTAYNLPMKIFLNNLDYDLLNYSFNEVIKRHAALRTIFKEKDGVPYQCILKELKYNIEFYDLSDIENPYEVLKSKMDEDDEIVFDLEKRLFIVKLYKIDENKCCLYINAHHIIVDGWSGGILRKEVTELYEAKQEGRESNLNTINGNYIDYVKTLDKWFETEKANEMEKYWLNELKKPLPNLNLPTDYKRPVRQTYNGSFENLKVSKETFEKLKNIAIQRNTTIHILLLSIYFTLLNKVTKDKDIIVGVPVAGRELKKFENTVGVFINMLSIRIRMEDERLKFSQLLENVKQKSLYGYKNSLYPFNRIVSKFNNVRDLSRSPIFSTTFQYYDHIPFDNEGISQYDMSILCRESSGELNIRFEYNTDLFKNKTIKWYVSYMKNIIDQICVNPSCSIKEIKLLKDEEKKDIIEEFTGENVKWDNITMDKLFEECAIKNSSKNALIFKDENMTYGELNSRANKLANLLRNQENIVNGEPIGIMLDRSMDMIIAMVAVLKAGGAYIPIDPTYPKARISYMISNGEVKILISQEEYKEKIEDIAKESVVQTIVNINGNLKNITGYQRKYTLEDILACSDENLEIQLSDDSPMYIIYTSGSTGVPKGVEVSHRNVVNYIKWSIHGEKISSKDRMMLVTSMSFDISVFEIFAAITKGCELVIVPEILLKDSYDFLEYIDKNKVSIWHSVPTLMSQALIVLRDHEEKYKAVRDIHKIMLGGEAWSTEIARKINREFKNTEIVNMYGPTETTIWVTSYKIDDEFEKRNSIPIGKPIWNNKILIMDENMEICGINIVGNIYVSGKNVTPGYYKDKKKTNMNFNMLDGEIVYNTGDLGRYLSDGNIEYIGRDDTMVKVHGYRIETAEIENVMLKNKDINEVAVIMKEIGESFKLICFYTSNRLYKVEELRVRLGNTLPQYMIPSTFVKLDNMPYTLNGKVDKTYLGKIEIEDRQQTKDKFIEPRTEVEKNLVDIWKNVLEIKKVGVNDNFFSLGGDSFLVSKMHSHIDKLYPNKVKIVDIFTYSTISRLAELIMPSNNMLNEDDRVKEELGKIFEEIEAGEVEVSEAIEKLSHMEV